MVAASDIVLLCGVVLAPLCLQGCGGETVEATTTTRLLSSTTRLLSSTTVLTTTTSTAASSTATSTATTLPTCPPVMKGVQCLGGKRLKQVAATSPDECCNACAGVEGCAAWNFQSGRCDAMDSCVWFHENDIEWGGVSGFLEELPESYPISNKGKTRGGRGRYQVAIGRIEVETFECLHSKRVMVYYPKGPGPFHAVAFMHGYGGGDDGASGLFHELASLGLVALVPWSHSDCAGDPTSTVMHKSMSHDLLRALNFSRLGGAALHPVFGKVDWSATGLFGHSRGARYTPLAASLWQATELNVKAFVASHGGFNDPNWGGKSPTYNTSVPAMFTSGTLDPRTPGIKEFFERYLGEDKVFVEFNGGHHMEIDEGSHSGALNMFIGRFLSCQLAKNEEDCGYIYGSQSHSLCNAIPHPRGNCVVPPPSLLSV